MELKTRIESYFFLALAMIIAGSAVVAGKLVITVIPTFLATEMGLLVSLLILLPLTYLQRQKSIHLDVRTHCMLLAQAIFGIALYRIFILWGLQYTSATAGGLICSATPALIAVMAFFLLREKIPMHRIMGVGFVSFGILILNIFPFLHDSTQAVSEFKGNCLVLAAVFCESVFSIMSKASCCFMPPMFRTAMISLYAFVCLLPFALYDIIQYDFSTLTVASLLCIGYYGIFVSFLSYVFWFRGISGVQASVAASFTGFVPITAVILSSYLLNEETTFINIIGLLFIILGIYFSCALEKKNSSEVQGL